MQLAEQTDVFEARSCLADRALHAGECNELQGNLKWMAAKWAAEGKKGEKENSLKTKCPLQVLQKKDTTSKNFSTQDKLMADSLYGKTKVGLYKSSNQQNLFSFC